MGNMEYLSKIDSLLNDSLYLSTVGKIQIIAQSSPEGSVSYNSQLSERRKQSLEKYFTTHYPNVDRDLWLFSSVAENWDLFHASLVENFNLPQRDAVLSISGSEKPLDEKERLLKHLNNGVAWGYINSNILPLHRFGAGIAFIPIDSSSMVMPMAFEPRLSLPQLEIPAYINPIKREGKTRKPLFAIKTNMLYDVATALNLEIEVPISKRISVTAEAITPWWYSLPANFTMRTYMFTAGAKYWLGNRDKREAMTGLSVGVNAGYSNKYDLQMFSEHGVQGTYLMFGATIGYAHKIYKNLRLEYQLGLGVTMSDYKNYTMAYDTKYGDIKVFDYPWLIKRKTIVGPTQLRGSLVYMIFHTKRVK